MRAEREEPFVLRFGKKSRKLEERRVSGEKIEFVAHLDCVLGTLSFQA